MDDKQIIRFLLMKELEISQKIHNTIEEVMRLGLNSERGKEEIPEMINSIESSLEDIKRIINN